MKQSGQEVPIVFFCDPGAKHRGLRAHNKGSTKVLMFPFANPLKHGVSKAHNEIEVVRGVAFMIYQDTIKNFLILIGLHEKYLLDTDEFRLL